MYNKKKIVVVLPAFNAALTIEKTYLEIPFDIVDEVILVDDFSKDNTPLLIRAMVSIIGSGLNPVVFGSRILGKSAIAGGMPRYKYFLKRLPTLVQNILMNQKLTEYHTGFRAYSAEVLKVVNFELNSDDFIFDNEMIALIFYKRFNIAEITCPTKYFEEASSINFRRSFCYGLGVLRVSILYFLTKTGIYRWKLLKK